MVGGLEVWTIGANRSPFGRRVTDVYRIAAWRDREMSDCLVVWIRAHRARPNDRSAAICRDERVSHSWLDPVAACRDFGPDIRREPVAILADANNVSTVVLNGRRFGGQQNALERKRQADTVRRSDYKSFDLHNIGLSQTRYREQTLFDAKLHTNRAHRYNGFTLAAKSA